MRDRARATPGSYRPVCGRRSRARARRAPSPGRLRPPAPARPARPGSDPARQARHREGRRRSRSRRRSLGRDRQAATLPPCVQRRAADRIIRPSMASVQASRRAVHRTRPAHPASVLRARANAPGRARARCGRRETDRRMRSYARGSNLPRPHSLASGDRPLYISAAMNRDQLLNELSAFLRIPSVSTLPAHNQDCRAAAEWVAQELRRLGCHDVQFLGSETHPVVWGAGPEIAGAPTLLIYGHYDVQPPDPLAEWTTPPFEPTVRDGRLYARGAADDKGQVFCLLKAIAASPRPPVNF